MQVESLSDVMGAAVSGVDLADTADSAATEALNAALARHVLLCVRGQDFGPAGLARAAARFGPLKTYVTVQDRLPDVPEVSVVSNRPPGFGGKPMVQARYWHTDDSYLALPATLTILQAKTLPDTGGDTEFINCYLALDRMPADLRRRIEGLRAVHVYRSRRAGSPVVARTAEERAATPDVDHPLIRTHPVTGRQALYINPNRIDRILGWGEAESDALLDELYAHAFRPEFQYRHRWRPGDVVIWDNRCAMHRANDDYDLAQLRVMHRVMLEGERPV